MPRGRNREGSRAPDPPPDNPNPPTPSVWEQPAHLRPGECMKTSRAKLLERHRKTGPHGRPALDLALRLQPRSSAPSNPEQTHETNRSRCCPHRHTRPEYRATAALSPKPARAPPGRSPTENRAPLQDKDEDQERIRACNTSF